MHTNTHVISIHNRILELVSSEGELHFHDIIGALSLDPRLAQRALAQLIHNRRLNIRIVDGLRRFALASRANREAPSVLARLSEEPGWSHLM